MEELAFLNQIESVMESLDFYKNKLRNIEGLDANGKCIFSKRTYQLTEVELTSNGIKFWILDTKKNTVSRHGFMHFAIMFADYYKGKKLKLKSEENLVRVMIKMFYELSINKLKELANDKSRSEALNAIDFMKDLF